MGASNNGNIVHDFNIDELDLLSSEFGYDKVWDIFSMSDLNEIQFKIRESIKWFGKGINDYDMNQTFIHLIFAIESILNHNNKNEIITAGISHKISEALAFIISDNKAEEWKFLKNLRIYIH